MIPNYLTRLLCIAVILTCVDHLLLRRAVAAAPAPASNPKMIIGVWEITKSDDGTPVGTTIEFTRDGKLKITTKVGDAPLNLEGTYKVDGDKLTVTVKSPDEGKEMSDTVTITKLTEKVLITKDTKGKSDEFKKKK